MTTWYDIIEPHDDIKNGDFDEAIFAAKLGDVHLGKAVIDYNDPSLFFKKTYFTEGINNLLSMVYNKLKTGKGSSVVEIKTPFGGGKTHSLIAIYHYIKHGSKVKGQLPKGLELINADVAVIVGTQLNPLQGHNREGIQINTLWGEIAYQLGGKEGYQQFEQNDKEKVAPGKEKLRSFFEGCKPFVILCDEVLQYITKAQGVKYHNTNLASQTYAFLQELTETISSLHNGMLIVTLPSSYLEDFNEKEEESLAKLEKVFGRIESIETPVRGEEIYSIIQRRLFSTLKDEDLKQKIILNYFDKYQQQKDELPNKAKELDYKRKMELAYPFHPEVIDVLYERWGTFSSFQRTRGVLRLLANVIEDLYNREVNIDIILPSDIKLGASAVRQEFIKHIGSEYESIIGSDISGHEAKAIQLDKENKGWKHLAERIATSIFFYSFSGDKSERGATLEHIKFSVIHTDTITSMITEVLQRLNKQLWYLNEKGEMYRFSKIPNLNRMILDKKELFNEAYLSEMQSILQKETGNAFQTILWPKKSEDIPDNKEIKLIIMHPEEKQVTTQRWLEKKGNTFRTYKNTLIFALADPSGYGGFKEEIKTYLALKEIENEIKTDKESGLKEKTEEVNQRLKRIKDDISYNTRRMYNNLQIGNEAIALGQPTIGRESLSNWYKIELETREKIAANLHYRFIQSKFMEGKDKLETKIISDQFYKDPQFVIPLNQEVIKRSIQQGINEGAFGLAYQEKDDIDKDTIKYKSNIPTTSISLDEGEYLLSKQLATELLTKKTEGEQQPTQQGEQPQTQTPKGQSYPQGPTGEQKQIKETEKRYKKIALRIENIPASKIADLSRGVLMPISREIGSFNFHMEIHIQSADGVSEKTIKDKVKETISQIGAKITKDECE
jgi:hypothetical protein